MHKLLIVTLSIFIICLVGIATAEAQEISDIKINTTNQTLNITIDNLEVGQSYEVYSVVEGNDYSFAFFATNEIETVSIKIDANTGFYKVRKIMTVLRMDPVLIQHYFSFWH